MATAAIVTRSIQGESLSASADRLVNSVLLAEGVVGRASDSFKVAQDTGSNMQVRVGSGSAFDRAVVEGDVAGQGTFVLEHQNATQVLVIAASNPTNPRIDGIDLQVRDDTFDSSGLDEADVVVTQGTPAGAPSAPAIPSTAIRLATVAVGAGVTAITNANITDTRVESRLARPSMRYYTQAATGGPSSGTTQLILAELVIPDQGYDYLVIPSASWTGSNDTTSDEFALRIRDGAGGTVLGHANNRHANATNFRMIYAITNCTPLFVTAGSAKTVALTVTRTVGTGVVTTHGGTVGFLSALVIPASGING